MKLTAILLVLAVLLSSCIGNGNEPPAPEETEEEVKLTEEEIEPVYKEESVVIIPNRGYLGTSLEKSTELTPYFSPGEVDQYLAYPMIHTVGDTSYVMRVFPKELEGKGSGSYDAYNSSGEPMENRIEVYRNFDFSAEPELILLPALNERDTVIYGVSANADGTYTVYGNQKEAERVYQMYLYRFDADGNLLEKGNPELDTNKVTIYYPYGDSLYYVQQNQLKRESMTGTKTAIDSDVIAFTRQGYELYYVRSMLDANFRSERSLWVYDLITGEKREISPLKTGRKTDSIAYDAENRVLYFSDYSYIYAHPLDLQGDIKVAAAYNSSITLLDAENGCLSLINGNYQVAMYSLPESPVSMNKNRITLRVCVADMEKDQFEQNNRDLILAMEVNGIAVTIEETYNAPSITSDEYVNTMAKKLLAGDSDFDLFMVSTRMSQLFKKGYYEDLTNYPVLNYYFSRMQEGVEKLCSIGDTWVFVPHDLTPVMAVADTSLTGGKNGEIPGTLDELLPYMDRLMDTLRGNDAWFIRKSNIRRVVDLWFEQYIANCMAKTVDDDTARADLVKLYDTAMKMISHPAVAADSEAVERNGRTEGEYFSRIRNFGVNSGLKDTDICAPVPKINPAYGDPVNGTYFAVNPNSENKELAALFLAYFMENYRESARYYAADAEIGSTGAHALYAEQIGDGIRAYELSGWVMFLNDKLEKLQSGDMTPETAVDETFRYLKMIRDE